MMETMYEYRHEHEIPVKVDVCNYCGYEIVEHEEYYDIDGTIICNDCMGEFKCVGGEE